MTENIQGVRVCVISSMAVQTVPLHISLSVHECPHVYLHSCMILCM